jgi:hypothetical protein
MVQKRISELKIKQIRKKKKKGANVCEGVTAAQRVRRVCL